MSAARSHSSAAGVADDGIADEGMSRNCDTRDNATHEAMLPAPPQLAHTKRKAPGRCHVALICVSHLTDMMLRPER
jgi:hypothetical protein